MQIPQTTYNEFPPALQNGIGSKNGPKNDESRFADGAVTVGTFAMLDRAADGQCQAIPDATADFNSVALGAVLNDRSRSPFDVSTTTSGGAGQYKDGESVALRTLGKLGMYSENAATAGHDVYVRCTAAGADVNGQIRDGAAADFVKHPTAKFAASSAGAGVVLVKVA
jgi:hypothetical protein